MSAFFDIGIWMRDLILKFAGLLKDEWVPGIVSIGLIGALLLLGGLFIITRWRARAIIRKARFRVAKAGAADGFGDDYIGLAASFDAEDGRRGLRGKLATAWREYAETIIHDSSSGAYQNSIRPPV